MSKTEGIGQRCGEVFSPNYTPVGGKAQQGKARNKARQGKARNKAQQGKARQGKARQGKARQSKARQGTRQDKEKAGQGTGKASWKRPL